MSPSEFIKACTEIDAGENAQYALVQSARQIHEVARHLFQKQERGDVRQWLRDMGHDYSLFTVRGRATEIILTDVPTTAKLRIEDTFRGETDTEFVSIPCAWFYADNIEAILAAELDKVSADYAAHCAQREQQEEAEARRQFEELKERFSS